MSIKILSSKPVVSTNIVLNTVNEMPIIGLGTYRVKGDGQINNVLEAAFEAGYRAIDTAQEYGNEESIGKALKVLLPKFNLKREDIFITSKLGPQHNGNSEAVQSLVTNTLKDLGTNYLDLFLIHWPGTFGLANSSPEQAVNRHKLWRALIALYDPKNGPLKAIGVSNYTANHLTDLIQNVPEVIPAVNQVEFSPHWLQPHELISVCSQHKIALQAYASLGSTSDNPLVKDTTLAEIAKKHGVSPVQVLLRWGLQKNFLIIPKSVTPARIAQNIALDFQLSKEEEKAIDDIPNKQKYCWNPEEIA
uniref:Alcohol dehydrogenase [NADP(+)] n=1 Tax=Cacopsylla melanoneura TaxID=428564 RepID=A0A8D9B9X5_9HEMI